MPSSIEELEAGFQATGPATGPAGQVSPDALEAGFQATGQAEQKPGISDLIKNEVAWQAKGVKRGFQAAAYGTLKGTQSFWKFFDDAATIISNVTGLEKGGAFKALEEMAEPPPEWTPENLAEKIVSGLYAAPAEIGKISMMPGGFAAKMAQVGAVHGTAEGGPVKGAYEAVKGALLGGTLKGAAVLPKAAHIPAVGGIFGAQAAIEGEGPEEIATATAVGAGLGVIGGRPGKPLKSRAERHAERMEKKFQRFQKAQEKQEVKRGKVIEKDIAETLKEDVAAAAKKEPVKPVEVKPPVPKVEEKPPVVEPKPEAKPELPEDVLKIIDKFDTASRKRPSQGEMRKLRDMGLAKEYPDHSFALIDQGREVFRERMRKRAPKVEEKPPVVEPKLAEKPVEVKEVKAKGPLEGEKLRVRLRDAQRLLNPRSKRSAGKMKLDIENKRLVSEDNTWSLQYKPPGPKTGTEGSVEITQLQARPEVSKLAGEQVAPTKPSPAVPTEAKPMLPVKSQKSRNKIIEQISKKLKVPFRIGRFREKAEGIYKHRAQVVRTKRASDVETAIHEVGHHVERLLGMPRVHTLEVQKLAYEGAENTSREGFAEFLRLYVTQPVEASKRAPTFYKDFEQRLGESPEIQDAIVTARQSWEAYQAMPSVQKVMSQIVQGGEKRKMPTLNQVYTMLVDQNRPLQELMKRAEVKKGRSIRPAKDVYLLATLTKGWSRKAEQWAKLGRFQLDEEGGVRFTGESLREILQPIEQAGERLLLDSYLASKRIVSDPRLSKKYEEINELQHHKQTVKELEGKFEEVAKKTREYNDDLLEYLVNSGRISQEAAEKIREANPFYAPLYRLMDVDSPSGGLGRRQFGNLFNPIMKLKGSTRDILSPTESMLKNTYTLMNMAEKNRVGEALAEVAEIEGMGEVIERVPFKLKPVKLTTEEALRLMGRDQGLTPREMKDSLGLPDEALETMLTSFRPDIRPGKNEILVFRKGEPELYHVADQELYKSLLSIDAESVGTLIRMTSYPSKWLRAGATLSPEFVVRNPARDQLTAFVYSKYGYKPGYDLLRGIFHMVGKTDLYKKFNASGAAHAALVSLDRNYLKTNLKKLLRTRKRNLANVITNPLETMQILSELTEEGTRVAEFARGIKKEGQSLDAMLKAGGAARDVTLDFSRIGAQTKSINMITAFWNAQVQGADKFVRELKNNPKRFFTYGFLSSTVPSVLLWYAQKDDKYFQEIPEWERILFYNIITHNPDGSFRNHWRIPKPFELGILFGSVPEMALDWAYEKDPDAFKETGLAAVEAFLPGMMPDLMRIVGEQKSNYSYFFDRPIVPRGKEVLEPVLQFGGRTPETIKLVARGMAKVPLLKEYASPARIQHIVSSLTAGVGRTVLEGMDAALIKSGIVEVPPELEKVLADTPALRAFMGRMPSGAMRSIERFYRKYGKKKTEWESKKERTGLRGKGFKLGSPAELLVLETAALLLGMARKQKQRVFESKTLSSKEKRKQIDNLNVSMANIARRAIGKEAITK